MNKKIIWVILVIILIIILVVWAGSKNSQSNTIKIGGIFSITGSGSAYGEPAQKAMRLAIEDINKKGGISGKLLEGVYEDSQFDGKIGLSAYQKLNADGINYFLSNASAVAMALKKPVLDNHDFQFETGAVTPLFSDGKPNTCRVVLTAPVSGEKLGEFISKKLNAKSFASLTLNDDYGKAMTESTAKVLAENGVVVKGKDTFDKNATDFKTQITKLSQLQPDVLLVVPTAIQAEALFKQLHDLKWKGIIVSDGWTVLSGNIKNFSLMEGVYFVNYDWFNEIVESDSQIIKDFKNEYMAKYGTFPPVIAANTYESIMLLAKGIDAVGLENPEAVGKWLTENIKDYQGVTGSVTLNSDCESTRHAIIQQIKDGKPVLAE